MLHIKGTAVMATLEAIKARAGEADLDKIISHLDPETQKIFQRPISPSLWYSCDAFSRFLEADIRETAGGNEQELVKRAEAVIEKQLSGIYKMFVRLGSPEFVIRRIAAVHSTYFDGVQIIPEMKGPNSATIQYVGFSRNHRIMGLSFLVSSAKRWKSLAQWKWTCTLPFPSRRGENFASWP